MSMAETSFSLTNDNLLHHAYIKKVKLSHYHHAGDKGQRRYTW
jgi:hypothetical protein